MKIKLLILAIIASVLTLALPSWAQESVLSNEEIREISQQVEGHMNKYRSSSNFIKSIMEGNVEVKDLEIIINIAPDDNTLFDTALENLTKKDIITGFPAQILFDKAFKDNTDMTHKTAAIIEKIDGNPDKLIVHYKLKRITEFRFVDGKKEYITEKDGTLLEYWADELSDSDNDKVLAIAKVLLDNNARISDATHYTVNKYGSEESKKLLESAEEAREE